MRNVSTVHGISPCENKCGMHQVAATRLKKCGSSHSPSDLPWASLTIKCMRCSEKESFCFGRHVIFDLVIHWPLSDGTFRCPFEVASDSSPQRKCGISVTERRKEVRCCGNGHYFRWISGFQAMGPCPKINHQDKNIFPIRTWDAK